MNNSSIVVVLPCLNEAVAIADVVKSFKKSLPEADIFVFDNNSTDDTAVVAKAAGAYVHRVAAAGKGNVLRQAFALLDADIYVIADGDGTYDASVAGMLVGELVRGGLDMVVGARRNDDPKAYRRGHTFGNKMFNRLFRFLFAREVKDLFSGYRVLSRSFVKSFPALTAGFETEAEMSLHAIQLKLPFVEVETVYVARQEGSHSKLNSIGDGLRILSFMLHILKQTRPMSLFSAIAGLFAAVSLIIGLPVVAEFLETGLVPRIPTAIAAAALMIVATVCLMAGIILDSVAYGQREQKRLAYLNVKRNEVRRAKRRGGS
jgi:glycosyltransferase involved in cell wall biosynthesis